MAVCTPTSERSGLTPRRGDRFQRRQRYKFLFFGANTELVRSCPRFGSEIRKIFYILTFWHLQRLTKFIFIYPFRGAKTIDERRRGGAGAGVKPPQMARPTRREAAGAGGIPAGAKPRSEAKPKSDAGGGRGSDEGAGNQARREAAHRWERWRSRTALPSVARAGVARVGFWRERGQAHKRGARH